MVVFYLFPYSIDLGSLRPLTFFDKFGVECPSRTDRIPLVLFGGMVEAPFSTNEALITMFPTFESFLSTCNPDNLLESIDILNFYVKERIISPKYYKVANTDDTYHSSRYLIKKLTYSKPLVGFYFPIGIQIIVEFWRRSWSSLDIFSTWFSHHVYLNRSLNGFNRKSLKSVFWKPRFAAPSR